MDKANAVVNLLYLDIDEILTVPWKLVEYFRAATGNSRKRKDQTRNNQMGDEFFIKYINEISMMVTKQLTRFYLSSIRFTCSLIELCSTCYCRTA